ncbi:MAG: chlorite dismutase family protein [Thermoleophilaceae bacterium]|nr:chlorite dismutase family protein [Thermoleophilaceae bacterium]
MTGRTFVKFTFIKVDASWRRRPAPARARDKRDFAVACRHFGESNFLRTYSLVGTRGDADLMVRAVSPTLDPIHELHVLLNQTGLMRWAEVSHSYLAMTKPSPYSDEERPLAPRPNEGGRYLIVYPMWKKREWYLLAADERMRIMRSHIEVGRRYTSIDINTAYSYGLDDQEFVVSFDADDPGDFLDLVHELRGTESSSYTLSETPIFTCLSVSPERALNALDGEATASEPAPQPEAPPEADEQPEVPAAPEEPDALVPAPSAGDGAEREEEQPQPLTRRELWRRA